MQQQTACCGQTSFLLDQHLLLPLLLHAVLLPLLQVQVAATTVGSRVTWPGTAPTPQPAAHHLHTPGVLAGRLASGAPLPLHPAAWQAARMATGCVGGLGPASSVGRRGIWLGSVPTPRPAPQRPQPSSLRSLRCATIVVRRGTMRASALRAHLTGQGRGVGPATTAVRRGTWHATAQRPGEVCRHPPCALHRLSLRQGEWVGRVVAGP
jgi:hypothetical protein